MSRPRRSAPAVPPSAPNRRHIHLPDLPRSGRGDGCAIGRSAYLWQETDLIPRHFGGERIGLSARHRIDPKVPSADQVDELLLLQREGKIRHIGLSVVTVSQREDAQRMAEIVSVAG
ncbi:aldo/keto reductase [Streptomyces fagopyri]|uniref:aldo/keto reductase n=1 Tax=Streptomyces fagopyri TaxID=2662397 RepID=UPI0038026983